MTGWLGGLALSKAMFSILISSVLHAASLWLRVRERATYLLTYFAWLAACKTLARVATVDSVDLPVQRARAGLARRALRASGSQRPKSNS